MVDICLVSTADICPVETTQISILSQQQTSVLSQQMSSVETGQMTAVETGKMTAAETSVFFFCKSQCNEAIIVQQASWRARAKHCQVKTLSNRDAPQKNRHSQRKLFNGFSVIDSHYKLGLWID